MFTATLFIIAKKLGDPNMHHLISGETKYGIFVHIYSSIKMNEIPIHTTIWVNR
jgi:hypothetical protein